MNDHANNKQIKFDRSCLSAFPLASAIGLSEHLLGDARFDNYWCARGNLKNGTYAAQTNQLQMIAYDRQAELARTKATLAQKQAELEAARSGGGDSARIASLEAEVKALQGQIQAMMQ